MKSEEEVVTKYLGEISKKVAERQGFEPWDGHPSLVFKTSAFDHSATSPRFEEGIFLILVRFDK